MSSLTNPKMPQLHVHKTKKKYGSGIRGSENRVSGGPPVIQTTEAFWDYWRKARLQPTN